MKDFVNITSFFFKKEVECFLYNLLSSILELEYGFGIDYLEIFNYFVFFKLCAVVSIPTEGLVGNEPFF